MGMKIALRHLESSHATQLNADRYVARKQKRIRGSSGTKWESSVPVPVPVPEIGQDRGTRTSYPAL